MGQGKNKFCQEEKKCDIQTNTGAAGMRCPEKSHVDSPRKNGCQLLLGQRLAGTRSQEKLRQLPAPDPMQNNQQVLN